MSKDKDETSLVQTRIPRKVWNAIRTLANDEGISVAAYLRRLLIREYKKAIERN